MRSAGLAGLLLAVLAAGNLLSARHLHGRLDLTRERVFTVAPATRSVLAELDDVVRVSVFFSSTLPPQVASLPARTRDILDELERAAEGQLVIDHLDPDADPAIEARARALGIPRIPLAVVERNRQQTLDVFLGLAVAYADQLATIPVVLDDTNLEYELLSAILRVTRPRPRVAFLAGHDERNPAGDYRTLARELGRRYELSTVELAAGGDVADDVVTLIVAGPRQPVDLWSRFQIDQFLMRGGRALFLIDAFDIDPLALTARPIEHGLGEQLAGYGVRPQPGLVADWGMQEMVNVPSSEDLGDEAGYRVMPYPLWPRLVGGNISSTHPTVHGLRSLTTPWTSPLELVSDAGDAFTVTPLMHSSPFATVLDELLRVHPAILTEPTEESLGKHLLGVAIHGPQTSWWAEREAPPAPAGDAASAAPKKPPRKAGADALLVVVGGSELLSDHLVEQPDFAANLVFALNAIDWLTVGNELLGVRSRTGLPPLLDPARLRDGGVAIAVFVNLLLMPAAVILFGFARRLARRRRQAALGAGLTG